ncbi:FAD-binding oxidoreductase [Deinococcus sp. SL84]|uniref:FAD-binding oxidoreductase n=1 Tax=Deinococcus sp. SL84 TaxID=2994663 RepID=UPI0022758249|nr:DUF5639 domain-containing protein [Deinococcus sp. SL84]MCY1704044.1 DUF5639 domain-containing protein [Deinococcus sp. SL84]
MSVLELNAADQTVTVSASCSCAELYAALPPGLLPPVPPLELPGGVGGLVTRGGFGQLFFFSADVLGLTFYSPSGRRIQAGGRTVKNVQGYDLTRLFVGSFGALGELEQVTLRLRPGHWSAWTGPGGPEALEQLPAQARFGWLDRMAAPDLQLRVLFTGPVSSTVTGNATGAGTFADAGTFAGAEPVTQVEDWSARFPRGLGVATGPAAQVQDARFGWSDGGARPDVPPLFQRLAESL